MTVKYFSNKNNILKLSPYRIYNLGQTLDIYIYQTVIKFGYTIILTQKTNAFNNKYIKDWLKIFNISNKA